MDEVYALGSAQHSPEAVSVLVAGSVDGLLIGPDVARAVAPLVARHEYPGRAFGEVLHLEREGPDWLAAVEVL